MLTSWVVSEFHSVDVFFGVILTAVTADWFILLKACWPKEKDLIHIVSYPSNDTR